MDDSGIVYVLKNAAMPGLIKIGKTRGDAATRMGELYTSGVPVPFECVYAALVKDIDKVEKAFHTAFAPNRINVKREFFQIEANQAVALIKLLEIQDVTPRVIREGNEGVDKESQAAAKELTKKRPNLNFIEMGIPIGAGIISTKTGEPAYIQTAKTIMFRNEEMSLTRATRNILELDYSVAPGAYWTFNGKLLRDIYNETYQFPE